MKTIKAKTLWHFLAVSGFYLINNKTIIYCYIGTRDRDGYPLVVIPAPYSNGQCHTETYWKVLEKSLKNLFPAEYWIQQSRYVHPHLYYGI